MSVLPVQNPNHLPTLAYTAFCDFQGDLKHPMTPAALTKMRNSLMKHGVFVPKFVWFDADGNAQILDGHQTKQGLASLEADGWEIPPIPYVTVTAASRADAAEKLLQINSAYATINPQTTWLDTFDFPDVAVVLDAVEIPTLNISSITLGKDIAPTEWDEAFEKVPDQDRQPFQQMTFTVHDLQVEIIQHTIEQAKKDGKSYFEASKNQNSNGNALTFICISYGQR